MARLDISRFDMDGPALITPKRFGDARGWFCETWNARDWRNAGLPEIGWVQDNEAYSAAPGVLRGLHFQAPPAAQAKLIRVISGEIFDVFVDIRAGSASYGEARTVRLTAEGGSLLFVPEGFAHGYQTLTPDTRVAYKVSDFYTPEREGGLLWNDSALAIDWPDPDGAIMSDRDHDWPRLEDFQTPFKDRP